MPGSTQLDASIDLRILGTPVPVTIAHSTLSFELPLAQLGLNNVYDLLDFVIKLAEPARTLQLDPPWDLLREIPLPGSLTFALANTTTGFSFTAAFDLKTPFTIVPDVLTLTSAGISYQRDSSGSKRVMLTNFKGLLFPGTSAHSNFAPPDADMLRRPPPSIPSPSPTPPIFQLDYLGLGQHVSLLSSPSTMAGVIGELTTGHPALTPSQNPLTSSLTNFQFDASAGWLVGTKFSAAKFLTLSAVFNDPNLYGLLLSISGSSAPKFLDKFSLEILYRRISDNLGVYHIELKVPDEYRQFDVGEASVTLPIIDLDVFTNGDFLFDFGFPWNRDFSRCLTIQVIVLVPVIAAAGFYFGVLDPQTAAVEEQVSTTGEPLKLSSDLGTFNPVLVFGFAVQIGLGKTIQKGVLQAGFAVTIEASLQGVLAVFNPTDASQPQSAYFQVTGTAGLSIHLFGSVNLSIIRATVDVLLTASVQIVFTVYQPVIVSATASVSVSLEVDVDLGLFSFHFQLSFSATVSETFTIGHTSPAPWGALTAG